MTTDNKDGLYRSDDFQAYFKTGNRSLIMKANLPLFTVLAVSDKYLALVHKQRSEVLNHNLFEVFPGSAADPSEKNSVFSSFKRVIDNKKTDELPTFKYEIYNEKTGRHQTEHWTNVNEPIFDKEGNVVYIINTTTNITEQVLAKQAQEETGQLKASLHRGQMLNEELASANEELRAVNEELHISQTALTNLTNELEDRVKRRTQQIKNSEIRFRSLVEQIPAAINVFLTADLIVDLPNSRMLEIWGRTFEEVNGKPLAVAMPELEGQPFMQKLRDVITTGIAYSSTEEKAFIQRNGQLSECYFNIVYQPIVNEDGVITSLLQIASEITEEVVARQRIQGLNEDLEAMNEELTSANEEQTAINEELLQAQNDYIEIYNQLLKNKEELVFTINAATLATFDFSPATGRFTGNDLLKSWFGLKPEEEIELQKATDAIAQSDREHVIKAISKALQFSSGGNYDIEYTISYPDNAKPRIVRAKGKTKFDENHQPIQLSGIVQDITEQKRDDQRKNDFIGMVSHEMKTPLTSLSGYLQLLEARITGKDAFSINMLDKANKQINKITTLINGFLNVSRLESGKIQIDKKRFDMAALIKEAEEEVISTINSHKIIFQLVEATFVNADRDKINQVINNLINNAVKYSPANTIINIACVTLDGCATVSVKDEGIGIKKEDQPKLFDRYYRVNNDNVTSVSGFGIGLYLCAEIIQRHEGKIWVESEVGKGSRFTFNLPVIES